MKMEQVYRQKNDGKSDENISYFFLSGLAFKYWQFFKVNLQGP
jgi:hypothetical protein